MSKTASASEEPARTCSLATKGTQETCLSSSERQRFSRQSLKEHLFVYSFCPFDDAKVNTIFEG